MATTKQKTQEEVRQENIEATVSKTEQFYNENKKKIWGAVIAVLAIGLAAFLYSKFIYAPKCAEAQASMTAAEASFAQGSYDLALNGDGNTPGFLQIIEDYGSKAGRATYFYAGVCELQLGKYEEALAHLKKYKSKDRIMAARALACQGDCYVELGNYEEAVKCYKKAVKKSDDIYAAGYLKKAGLVYEKLGNKAEALEMYKTIEDKYPDSFEAQSIKVNIATVEE